LQSVDDPVLRRDRARNRRRYEMEGKLTPQLRSLFDGLEQLLVDKPKLHRPAAEDQLISAG
jgi:hypothetical protein